MNLYIIFEIGGKEYPMITKADMSKLSPLIEAFYNLTGIKVAVFDSSLEKIFSYPKKDSPLCLLIQNGKKSDLLCEKSTEELCRKCALSSSPLTHKCHAGLTEVVTPIANGSAVIGYIMFGQITSEPKRKKFINALTEKCKGYGIDEKELIAEAEKLPYYSDEKIKDAAKLLKALAGFIVYENIIYGANLNEAQRILGYISENLDKDLSSLSLCKKFFISKTELYKITSPYTGGGLAAYIKGRRIEAAKELLKKTNKSTLEIAAEVGFSDVNYFLRVFKKEVGESAAKYRKKK